MVESVAEQTHPAAMVLMGRQILGKASAMMPHLKQGIFILLYHLTIVKK